MSPEAAKTAIDGHAHGGPAEDPTAVAVQELFGRTVSLSSEERSYLLDGEADSDVVSRTMHLLTAATVLSSASEPPPETADEPPPEKVGRYQITGVLGQGGFGIVYSGRDTVLKRPVAIKTCISSNPEVREQFVHEAEISAALQHPNVVTIYDFGVEDGVPYLVQELLSGEDMADTILHRPATPEEVEHRTEVLMGVAKGLAHAHRHGVIHRDIKPGNVRLTDTGNTKLLDFGIARLLHHPTELSSDGTAAGTVGYLAPEQLEGKPVTKAADIFSFGAMAYEWLSGQRAFPGKSFQAVAYNLLFRPVHLEPLRLLGVPEGLVELIARCLEKDPERRCPDAQALTEELDTLARSAEGTASSLLSVSDWTPSPAPSTETPAPRTGPPAWARPVWIAAAVLLLGGALWLVDRPADSSSGAGASAARVAALAEPSAADPGAEGLGSEAEATATGPLLPTDELPAELGGSVGPASDADPSQQVVISDSRSTDPPPADPVPASGSSSGSPDDRLGREPTLGSRAPEGAAAGAAPSPGSTSGPALGEATAREATPERPAEIEPTEHRMNVDGVGDGGIENGTLGGGEVAADENVPSVVGGGTAGEQQSDIGARAQPAQPTDAEDRANGSARDDTGNGVPIAGESIAPTDPEVGPEPVGDPDQAIEPEAPRLYVEGEPGVVPPQAIDRPTAEYPRRARRRQISTQVVVAVLVDAEGNVDRTLIERRDRSGLGFNEAAEAAASKTRFQPATKNGVPGSMWTRLIYDFGR